MNDQALIHELALPERSRESGSSLRHDESFATRRNDDRLISHGPCLKRKNLPSRRRAFNGLSLFALALAEAFSTSISAAQTLRVTSWNLGMSQQMAEPRAVIEQAAATLNLLNPDVVLLQGVQDWHTCEQLADLLKPADYHVLICTAFQGTPPAGTDRTQVAILSRRNAYFTWSEEWQSQKQQPLPRGVAFAAIETGTQRIGFFTALSGSQRTSDNLPQRILGQMSAVGRWETNQIQTFVIAASFDGSSRQSAKGVRRAASAFDNAGLVDATEDFPPALQSTLRPKEGEKGSKADCVFAGPMGFPTHSQVTATPIVEHYPITCDVELDPAKVSLALDVRGEKRREQKAQAESLIKKIVLWTCGSLAAAVIIGMALKSRSKRRMRTAAPTRVHLPVRVTAKSEKPATLRPIIFAEAPDKRAPSPLPSRPQRLRPTLRLQRPSQPAQEPTVEPPPLPPLKSAPESAQDSDAGEENQEPTEPIARQPEVAQEPEVRQGVIRELSGWLKQKLVRKLVQDRTQLMQAQQLATRMASTLDNRLARIEEQIQRQNQAYVRRIEELNKELAAAREENRELIRERIAQVKAEMEAARARVLAEAKLHNSSIRL